MVDVDVQMGVDEDEHNADKEEWTEVPGSAQQQIGEEDSPRSPTATSLNSVDAGEATCTISDPIATSTATSSADSNTREDRQDTDDNRNGNGHENGDNDWEEMTTINGASTVVSDLMSIRHLEAIGITGTAVVFKAQLTMVGPSHDGDDNDDEAAQERTARVAKRRSTTSQVSCVSAARIRSMRWTDLGAETSDEHKQPHPEHEEEADIEERRDSCGIEPQNKDRWRPRYTAG